MAVEADPGEPEKPNSDRSPNLNASGNLRGSEEDGTSIEKIQTNVEAVEPAAVAVNQSQLQACISDLPNDVLLEILRRADNSGKKTSLVCRPWYSLHRGSYTTLRLRGSPFSYFPLKKRGFGALVEVVVDHWQMEAGMVKLRDSDLAKLIEEFPGLQKLGLVGCDHITPDGLMHMLSKSTIGDLYLEECSRFDEAAIIAVVRAAGPRLKTLRIPYYDHSRACIITLSQLTSVIDTDYFILD